ncbi:MAG: RseA family anti-sigma factor [Gammaproteobacteria bacterium]|nr:RseA family anti-sigma factor [Gammaproteobacteria bacterium]
MTEKARELLSALIDGEASEIEIHRFLRQLGEDDSLIDAWVSYQETRRVLRSPSNKRAESVFHLNTRQHLELHRRISKAVGEDSSYSEAAALFMKPAALFMKPVALFMKPAAVLAMVASLVVAVFIGIQVNTPGGNDIASDSQAIGSQTLRPPSVATQPVSAELARGNESIADDLGLNELDEEGQRRLRAYLNQHERMSRMKLNTSLVTYPNQPNN